MKTKLIMAGLLSLVIQTKAQVWTTNFTAPGRETTPGRVGIGTVNPGNKVEVVTGTADDGIKITQTTLGSAALILNNTTTGGKSWSINSLGAGNNHLAGNFSIYDNVTSRFFISGSTGNAGISNTTPGNRLEITKGVANSSGLRFTNLTSSSPAGLNPGQGVLALDPSGDVIYVSTSGGGTTLGNYCNSSLNALTGNYQISTAGNNFNFTDDSPLQDKVSVGYTCNSPTIGKFNSFTKNPTNTNPVFGLSPHSIGIYGVSALTHPNNHNVGTMGDAQNFGQDILVYGVWGRARADGGNGIGVRGSSEWNNSHTNLGGSFYAASGLYNIGANANARPSNSNPAPLNYVASYPAGANIGIYAACSAPNPVTPFSPPTQDYAGWFDGDVNIVGNAYCSLSAWTSDKRFKTNINEIKNVTEKISKLKGYTYEFKTEEFKHRGFPSGEQIGFIAQELKELFPELVVNDKQGYLAVNYVGFIPVLLEGFKEQQKLIELLQQQLNEQKQLIDGLNQKSSNTTGINSINNVETGFQMSQNEPNPFTHETVVKYALPTTVANAFMAVYDLTGKQITTFPINEKGASSLTITSEKLAAGIYIYSIVADGKVVDSKRMIVAEK